MIANFVSKFYENWIILDSNSAVAIADLKQEELKKNVITMTILHNIVDILTIIVTVAVVVGPLTTMALACHQVTGTWNLRSFYFNRKYWAMSILNFRYKEEKEKGKSGREFVRHFNSHYLSKGFWGFWKRLNDEERRTFVEVLSNPGFIESNLGLDKYTIETHRQIMASWEELRRRYAEKLARLESNNEL